MENNKKISNSENGELKKKKLSKRIIIGILIVVIGFGSPFIINFLMQAILQTQHPLVVVVSDSMNPAIYRGDLLILQGKNPIDIVNGTIEGKNGDIIVYDAHGVWDEWPNGQVPDEPIVHRIVNKWFDNSTGEWMFYTKGDNDVTNTNIDPPDGYSQFDYKYPVPEDKILGVVIGRVPYIGYFNIFLSENNIFLYLIIGILGTLLIISVLWDIISPEKEKEKEKESKLIKEKDKERRLNSEKIIIQDEFEE